MSEAAAFPKVVDLFSGVGGLSLGAARAGFHVAASVELDAIAAKSHAFNFPSTQHLETDVACLEGRAVLDAAGLRPGQLDGLIGGPPCQGFSSIGRRQEADPRNALFGHFFRLVAETRPAFYMAENVPGILADSNNKMIEHALARVPKNYVQVPVFRVEANRYGAPTTRTRVFFVGYDPNRVDALCSSDFLPAQSTQVVTVREALLGLPTVRSDWQREDQSWRQIALQSETAFSLRTQGSIPPGVGNIGAIDRLRTKREASGFLGTKHSPETIKRFARLKQGEVDSVYRSPRLKLDGFCPTLRAGTGSDRGSYQAVRPIHPTSPRVISPREAARFQGFPDWFVFNPTKWHSFRQIGNSVSPIVAEYLLRRISSSITKVSS